MIYSNYIVSNIIQRAGKTIFPIIYQTNQLELEINSYIAIAQNKLKKINNLPIRTKLEEQQINTKVSIVNNSLRENIKSQVTSCAPIKTTRKEIISQYQENVDIHNCYSCAIHTN